MIEAQLDSHLIDYYKLVVSAQVKAGDSSATDTLDKLRKLILMDYSHSVDKQAEIMKLLEEMDTWKVTVDPKSIKLPPNRLIRRKKGKKI